MKIFENISSGYKRIATGIAIIGFLSMMYLALIPGASVAYVYGASGEAISGALVFIKEWPQYNATTDGSGIYTMPNVPYGTYNITARAYGYFPNTSTVTVDSVTVTKDFTLSIAEIYESVFLLMWQSDYDSAIHIRNPQNVTASVIIDIYYANGTLAGSSNYNIVPNASVAVFTNDIMGFRADGAYSARITANVPIVMTSDVRAMGSSILSSVPGQKVPTSSKLYSSFILSDVANNVDSAIHIRNPQNTSVNTTVELYYSNGILAGSKTYTIPANGMVADFTSAILGNSNYFNGSVKFNSTAPVVSTTDVRSMSTGVLASIPGQEIPTSNAQESVFLLNGYGYESYIQVLNPQSFTNNVTVNMYYDNGDLAETQIYIMQPMESKNINVNTYAGGSIVTGSAKVTSLDPVIVQSSVLATSSKVYASVKSQIPKLKLNGAWTVNWAPIYDAAIHIRNPQSTNATVTVYVFNTDGTLAGSKAYVVGQNSMAGYFITDILGSNINLAGSVLFESDKPVVVTNDIRALGPAVLTSQPGIE